MSHRGQSIGTVEEILDCYYQGYFPLYDWFGRFYWERPPERAIITLNAQAQARATRMLRRCGKRFTFAHNTQFDQVLACLSNPKIKPFTWVRPQVRESYRRLHQAGFIQTTEAFNSRGELAGAVLGIMLPNVMIAETMFMLEPESSKASLCYLVRELHDRGFAFIDVQTPHVRPEPAPHARITQRRATTPHPCVRLGETCCSTSTFLKMMHEAIADKIDGSFADHIGEVCGQNAIAR